MSVYDRECTEQEDRPTAPEEKEKPHISAKADAFAGLDRDTLLTAAVMLLMLRNGGDMRLIMALGYIIMGGKNERDK